MQVQESTLPDSTPSQKNSTRNRLPTSSGNPKSAFFFVAMVPWRMWARINNTFRISATKVRAEISWNAEKTARDIFFVFLQTPCSCHNERSFWDTWIVIWKFRLARTWKHTHLQRLLNQIFGLFSVFRYANTRNRVNKCAASRPPWSDVTHHLANQPVYSSVYGRGSACDMDFCRPLCLAKAARLAWQETKLTHINTENNKIQASVRLRLVDELMRLNKHAQVAIKFAQSEPRAGGRGQHTLLTVKPVVLPVVWGICRLHCKESVPQSLKIANILHDLRQRHNPAAEWLRCQFPGV